MRQKKTVWVAVVFLLTAVVIALALAVPGTQEQGKNENRMIRPVKAMTLEQQVLAGTRSFPGTVKAASDVRLAFRVSGPIIEFSAGIGVYMNRGDVIARIDPRDYEVQIKRIKAGIREAQAGLKAMRTGARTEDLKMLKAKLSADQAQFEQAELTFSRYAALFKEKAVSKATYDQARTAYDMAKAKVKATQQELHKAQTGARIEEIDAMTAKITGLKASLLAAENALEDTVLTMPFNGYISAKYTEEYETIAAGLPVVSCIDISRLEVQVGIPEDFFTRQDQFSRFYCTLDAFPGKRIDAVLKEIGQKTTGAGQTYPLTAIITSLKEINIKPGMAATLHIDLAGRKNSSFMIPVEAVFKGAGDSSCVWVIEPATKKVLKTRVGTGRLSQDSIEITTGLLPGQVIATAGVHHLAEGQEVNPIQDRAQQASGSKK